MNAILSTEERRLIDEAIAAGRVTKVPPGQSAQGAAWVWCTKTARLVDARVAHLPPSHRRKASMQLANKRMTQAYHERLASDNIAKAKRMTHEKVWQRRERVMELRAEGMTYAQIADSLGISTRMVNRDICAMRGVRQR